MSRRAPTLFLLVGVMILAAGLWLLAADLVFELRGVRATATVTENRIRSGTAEYVRYRFVVDGADYTGTAGPFTAEVGSELAIEYVAGWPSLSRAAGGGQRVATWKYVLCGVGALLLVVGVQWRLALRARERLLADLRARGQRARAVIERIDAVNHRVTYAFQGPAGERVEGHTLGGGAGPPAGAAVGAEIEVLYDPAEPTRNLWVREPL